MLTEVFQKLQVLLIMGTLTEESYLIALSLLLAPLQQSIPLRASVLSGQC